MYILPNLILNKIIIVNIDGLGVGVCKKGKIFI